MAKVGNRLDSNDRFLDHNIFSSTSKLPSQIHGFVEHDSLKTKGNEEFAKFLRREGVRDYYRRNIVHGLLDAYYATQGQSYIQFLPNPSNRRSIFGVRVTALNTKQAHEALLHIINAQRNRPDPATNPDLAKIKTYAKNWTKFKLPGLTGISITDKRSDKELLQLVLDHHSTQSAKLFERFYSDLKEANTPIQIEKLAFFAERMGFKPKNFVKQSAYSRLLRSEKNTDKDTTALEATRAEQVKQMTQEALALFNLNHTINSYSLSQWIYGDEAFFKHKEDETKRIQVATATGKRVLIDSVHGLPATSRVGVFEDIKTQVPELEGMRTDSLGDSFDATDAEGYMLPSFYHKVATSMGIESETDIVLKPVYYGITNGIPVAIKYSVKVLTDELVAKFPHLKTMRVFMEKNNLSQMVAQSAVKVGTPSRTLTANEYGLIDTNSLHPDAIVTIDNANLLLQLNPAHDVETTVANPSQGTSVMNTNGLNEAETQQLFNLNSLVIDLGLRKLNRKLKLTRKGTLTKKSLNEIRSALLKTSETIPGNRDLYYLLSHKDANGRHDVPMSLPLIASKVVSSIASIFSRDTVSFRFAGSKLVLQSDMGTQHFVNDRGELVTEPLKFKDEEGYTEVYLPASYREFFSEGDKVMMSGKDSLVGFRIPSSNYHSLLALKVKGFYPVPPASQGNVVIAPSPIVYYHGSDYDVDTLFIIRKESWKKPSFDLSPYISRYDSVDSDVTIPSGDIVGSSTVNNLPLHTYLETIILKYDQEIEDKRSQISSDLPASTKRELERELTSLTSSVDILTEIAQLSAKNAIVELFSSNLRNPKNRTDLLTPISFEQVASLKSRKLVSEKDALVPDGTPVKSLLQELESFSETADSELARVLKNLLRGTDIKLYEVPLDDETAGSYNRLKRRIAGNTNQSVDARRRTILHETFHALSSDRLTQNEDFDSAISKLRETVSSKLPQEASKRFDYELSNNAEFITAAFTEKPFRDYLMSLEYSARKSIWQHLIDIIKGLVAPSWTIADEVLDLSIEEILSNYPLAKNAQGFANSIVETNLELAEDSLMEM